MARGWVALVGWMAALGMAGCARAPEIEGPGPYLLVTIRQNLGGASSADRPSELEFQGAAAATADSHWARMGEIECDFPGGTTLSAPCFSRMVTVDLSAEPTKPAGLARRDVSAFTFFSPSKSTGKAGRPAPDPRRFGVSGGLAPEEHLPVGSGPYISYLACFPTRRLPLRYRIYEGGKLIRRGEVRLVDPKAPNKNQP